MNILGISAFYHDSAAALIQNGNILAAAQEERFSRKKNDPCFPNNAIQFCLSHTKLKASDLDYIVFYDKPLIKFERIIETSLAFAPKGVLAFCKSMPPWLTNKIFLKYLLLKEFEKMDQKIDWSRRLLFSEHHLSHAASAFFPSPFYEAAILTLDGVGEWCTSSIGTGLGSQLQIHKEIHFPHSLGLLYSAFTSYLGFKVNSGEYKIMGLAPYGTPRYSSLIFKNLIDVKEDGSFQLNMKYFDYCTSSRMTNQYFETLLGGLPRHPNEPIETRHIDLASSIQAVLDQIVVQITRSIAIETGQKNLCLAGGVALNCVTNSKILKDSHFKKIWIQPAAGDAGGALGAAIAVYHLFLNGTREINPNQDKMCGAYLGPSYSDEEIVQRLHSIGAKFEILPEQILISECVTALEEGKALGWFQGRMEFGPRALGGRSILADARSNQMQQKLNLQIKFRESFRPFAPAILREDLSDWFESDLDSPYMLIIADVHKSRRSRLSAAQESLTGFAKLHLPRSTIPAVTHVDYSARLQTVHFETHPLFHSLLNAFKAKTGCPLLVNTSFNVRGEPIVCTPEDAYRCFIGTGIEIMAIGRCLIRKDKQILTQSKEEQEIHKNLFELD